jgi:indole-3-glycerol phosphate synthase
VRSSINYGAAKAKRTEGAFIQDTVDGIRTITSVAAIGCHVDSRAYGCSYEDVEAIRTATPESIPVICNDFILYVYQVFRAKAAGADVIKLMASVLTVQEITYFTRVADTLGMSVIVVVSSKSQILDVLQNLPRLEALSVSGRNMRIWKVDPQKAKRILFDSKVIAAIEEKRRDSPFLLMQEGFASSEELLNAKQNGVDAVILGEELLSTCDGDIVSAVNTWVDA